MAAHVHPKLHGSQWLAQWETQWTGVAYGNKTGCWEWVVCVHIGLLDMQPAMAAAARAEEFKPSLFHSDPGLGSLPKLTWGFTVCGYYEKHDWNKSQFFRDLHL